MDLNKVTLIGNMVRDPESKENANGQSLTRFSLATSYAWQDTKTKEKRESVDFHNIIAWGRLGDVIRQYVKKGSKIYVEGRLRQRVFTAKDGQRRTKVEIVADNLIMLGHGTVKRPSAELVREDVDIEDES